MYLYLVIAHLIIRRGPFLNSMINGVVVNKVNSQNLLAVNEIEFICVDEQGY